MLPDDRAPLNDQSPTTGPSAPWYRIALGVIGLLWLALRIAYWNGFYTEDAPGYVTEAIWMALGQYDARDHVNGLNVGTYLPVALPIWLLGKSEVALGLWPLACSLLGLLAIAGLTRILFGSPASLLAAFLYATHPGDVFFSTVVMPDALQSGWLSFSLYLVASAYVRPDGRQRVWLAWGGVAMGMCHLIRANDVILLPVGLGAVAVCSRIWKGRALSAVAFDCALYASGWVLVNVLEGGVYLLSVQDFFHRLHVVTAHYGTAASIVQAGLNTDPRTIPFSLLAPLEWWVRGGYGQLNQDQAYHGLLFSWAVVALTVGLCVRLQGRVVLDARARAALVLAWIWCLWPLLYHQFGSQSLTDFVPIHRLSRHLVVYAPGAMFAIVTGSFLAFEASRAAAFARVRTLLVALGCAALTIHVYFNWRGEQIAFNAYHQIKGTYARIRDRLPRGVKTIVADPGDLCFLDFWLNPLGSEQVRMVAFADYSGCDRLTEGVVLTHSNAGWQGGAPVIVETVARLPCLLHPPASWRLVYGGYPEKIFEIAGESNARE